MILAQGARGREFDSLLTPLLLSRSTLNDLNLLKKKGFVLCSLFFVLCSLFFVLCSLFFVLCSLFVLYSVFFVLCSLIFDLCSLLFALCSLFFVLCSLFFVLCSLFFVHQQQHVALAKGPAALLLFFFGTDIW